MRIACELVTMRMTVGPRPKQKASKAQKAFIVMEKLRKTPTSLYQISFPVAGDRNANKFLLDKPPLIVCPLIEQGRLTLTFQTTPAVTVLISKSKPEELKLLIDYIRRIANGEEVDVSKVKIKSSDFKPTSIQVTDLADYRKQRENFSEFLKTLIFDPINLRIPDRKWATCTQLTTLSLNGNPFLSNLRDADVLGHLKSLQVLQMKECQLGGVPDAVLKRVFRTLPTTLNWLNLEQNGLKLFPPIFHLRELRDLNLANNSICYVPSRIGILQNLAKLNVCNNQLREIPSFCFSPRVESIMISGNEQLTTSNALPQPPPMKRLLTKIDSLEYRHPGGVDTLKTIAANAVHRNSKLMPILPQFLPLCLRFHVDDMLYDDVGITSLEMCQECKKLRHIRFARPMRLHSHVVRVTVDVVDQNIKMVCFICMDCHRRSQYHEEEYPMDPDFFNNAV